MPGWPADTGDVPHSRIPNSVERDGADRFARMSVLSRDPSRSARVLAMEWATWVGAFAMAVAMLVLLWTGARHGSAHAAIVVIAVPAAVWLFCMPVITLTPVVAGLWPGMKPWRTVGLRWSDYGDARRGICRAQDAQPFYDHSREHMRAPKDRVNTPRLAVVAALIAHGVTPAHFSSKVTRDGWHPVLRLLDFGISPSLAQNLLDGNSMRTPDLIDLFDDVPAMTVEGAEQFCAAGLFRRWHYDDGPSERQALAHDLNALYDQTGERAPWYARLDLSATEIESAERAGTSTDQLRLMVALSSTDALG